MLIEQENFNSNGPLKAEDVEWSLPDFGYSDFDEMTKAYLLNRNKNILQRRVNKVNANWKQWKEIWPEGSPYSFYVGLFLKKDDLFQFEKDLADPRFIHEILNTCKSNPNISGHASFKHDSPTQSPIHDLSPDDLRSQQNTTAPDIMLWNKKFRTKIANFYKQFWDPELTDDLSDFVQKTGFSAEQCKMIYQQLLDHGLLGKRSKKIDKKDIPKISGFTFIKKNRSYRVGLPILSIADNTYNPLKGYCDPLTGQPFTRPLMCQDYYVLNDKTWLKQINEHHEHPYTRKHLGSIRNLIEITTENFDQYKDKIVNLPELTKEQSN